jgi:hypothetical protein
VGHVDPDVMPDTVDASGPGELGEQLDLSLQGPGASQNCRGMDAPFVPLLALLTLDPPSIAASGTWATRSQLFMLSRSVLMPPCTSRPARGRALIVRSKALKMWVCLPNLLARVTSSSD